MNDREKTAHEVCCERSGQTGVVVKRPDRKPPQDRQHFEFDRVFAGEAAQDAVFADVKALVLSCVDGFNVCIFAYGQSGSGKTYTMAGGGGPVKDAVDLESWAVAASAGVIPRSCVEIFRVLDERAALNSYEVELSMYELYRDALRDLLADRRDKKPLFAFRRPTFSTPSTRRWNHTGPSSSRSTRATGSPPSRAASVARRRRSRSSSRYWIRASSSAPSRTRS